MNRNYVLSTLIATMSCTTSSVSANASLSDDTRGICPASSVTIPFEKEKYAMSSEIPSYLSTPQSEVLNDFDVLVSFARKMLENEKGIDAEIQQVINDNFWDML